MEDGVDTDDNVQRADSDGVTHPPLAPCARNSLFVPMMRFVTGSRRIHSVRMEKKPDRTPREVGLTYH
jgi:hypothetical protein